MEEDKKLSPEEVLYIIMIISRNDHIADIIERYGESNQVLMWAKLTPLIVGLIATYKD